METAIIILFSVLIGLTFGWLFLLRNTVRKHDKHLLEMEWEFKHLKALVNTNDKFVDKTYDGLVECSDQVGQLRKELQILEGIQSKMADELWKMNDLDKRIRSLEDDFTDLSRDFKALTTLGSTRPYTAPPYDPMYPQVTYDTNTKEIKD